MKQTTETLIAVSRIGELVTRTLATKEILSQVVAITAELMKVDVCSIYLFDTGGESLVLQATVGLRDDAVGRVRINPGEGITGRAAKQGRTVAVSDVTRDNRNKYIPITGEELYRSLLSVPLKFQEETIGVINVQTSEPREFEKNERRLLKTIAHLVSGLLGNARMYESVLSAKSELEETQEKLVQSEKMAALGRLAATLSHELRNPLAGLKGAAQLLDRKTEKRDSRSEYVRLILDEVGRLGRIVEDLLHFARPRQVSFGEIDANRIIEDSLLINSQSISNRGIKVHHRLSKLPPVRADGDKFKQVVVNIILNAIDAMPEGGDLIVSSGMIRHEATGGDLATFQFRDTGAGIPDDILANVYEPFYTTKATGVGLGLAVCRAIMEEHGGSITITSHPGDSGAGALVTLEFPIGDQKNN